MKSPAWPQRLRWPFLPAGNYAAAMADITTVGIVGSGIMGQGLAEVVARPGFDVVVRSRRGATAPTPCWPGSRRTSTGRSTRASSTPTTRDAALARISATDHLGRLADCDLVIESVVEDLAVKKQLFGELEQIVKPDAILATNTSTLPVVELAVETERPERVCGIHFFNPAPVMRLVEIVRPLTASDDTIETAMAFATACGKDAVEVADRAGFVVNALLFPYLNNAVRMLEQGTASRDDIDTAMQGGCNFPMGPFALLDLVGLDTVGRDPRRAVRRVPRPELRRRADRCAGWSPPASSAARPGVASTTIEEPCTAPGRAAADARGSSRRPRTPTRTGSSASAATSNRARCSPPTAAGCSRCRYGRRRRRLVVARPAGVIPLDGLRVSRSLRRRCAATRSARDTGFDEVMVRCADPRRPAAGSRRPSSRAYDRLHQLGWAHSVECLDDDGELVGGLYGVRDRRLLRRRVDVPTATGRLEGRPGRPRRAAARHRGDAARRAVADAAPRVARRGRGVSRTQYLVAARHGASAQRAGRTAPGRAHCAIERDRPRPPWMMRTYSGHSTAAASNELYRTNLAKGQTGLSIAFDLPTQTGYDPDAPMARGEVGKVGVPVAHLGHMRTLLDGIPPAQMNTSMTINATAAWLLALYVANADEQGVDPATLRGTTQNDIVKEYLSRGTYIFPPEPSRRLIVDMVAWCAEHAPEWNPMNVCRYHLQEAGATPVQEIAYALATAIGVLDAVQESGQVAAGPVRPRVRLDLVLRQRRHPLRRGGLQAAGASPSCGTASGASATASTTRRAGGSATGCRSTGSASPRPSPRTTCSASCSRCSPSRSRSGPGPAASSCRRGTRRSACPARGISSGRCGCNRCSPTRPTCSSTRTSSTARTSSRRGRPSSSTRPRPSSTTCSRWAARSRRSTS